MSIIYLKMSMSILANKKGIPQVLKGTVKREHFGVKSTGGDGVQKEKK